MNNYTRAVYFKDGQSKLITDEEMQSILTLIEKGAKFVRVQGSLISVDTIARVDSHHDTAMQQIRNESDTQRSLELNGRRDLVDERRKLIQNKSAENVLRINRATIKKLANYDLEEKRASGFLKKAEEDESKPDYYLNEFGEKMYS